MAVSVLENGDTLEVGKCEACNCVFSFVKTDIRTNLKEVLLGIESETVEYIPCPECGKRFLHKTIKFV